MNIVGNETIPDGVDNLYFELYSDSDFFTGWRTVKDSPPVNIACTGDTDSNGNVDVTDLLALVGNWGECEEEPINIPPDPDLI